MSATDTRDCLTPEAYAALREALDREPNGNWPWAHLNDENSNPAALRNARAAEWSALTAPRREALRDDALDDSLNRSWGNGEAMEWLPDAVLDGMPPGPPGYYETEINRQWWRQLRARLAFDGAMGADPEAVPQREPGTQETCPCVMFDHGFAASLSTAYSTAHIGDVLVSTRNGCQWCDGTGEVIDGRGEYHDYAGSLTVWAQRPATPAEVANEIAYRASQPDAFGHPASLSTFGRRERMRFVADWEDDGSAERYVAGGGTGTGWWIIAEWSGQSSTLARAPLIELIHGRNQ